MNAKTEQKPLLIIDGFGFIFRAYHVQPPLTSPSGLPVGALYGFTSMLLRLINDFKPEHAVIVLDHAGKNFRHELYKDYKANRPPAPDDLVAQLPLVAATASALNFINLSKEGFEADDIIATLATKANSLKRDAVIISSDKDLMQLCSEHVKMYDPVKTKYVSDDDIFKKFGVAPSKVREVQALMGDNSDNIPGVAGIGPKTAAALINQFGDLNAVLDGIDQVTSLRLRELLKTHRENALLSWKLVGLDSNVDIKQDIENFHWTPPTQEKISAFLNEYGFKSLGKRVENLFNIKIEARLEKITEKKIAGKIIEVSDVSQLESLMDTIKQLGKVAVNILRSENENKLILSIKSDSYIILYTQEKPLKADLFSYMNSQDNSTNFNQQIHELFEDKSIQKITYNLKELLRLVQCTPASFDDLQLMDYVLSAGQKAKTLIELLQCYCKQEINLEQQQIGLGIYFLEAYEQLNVELFTAKSLHLYQEFDLPLCYILHKMEVAGIKIDTNYLAILSADFAQKIAKLEQEIFSITGEKFNIASPKQLGEILFNKMKLPFAKTMSKSQSYSTDAAILEKLEESGHPIAGLLLEYRHLSKLKNTYTDTLPKQADPITHRIHTTFLQTVTSTGRLSSINPNVQNIPIRSEEGNNIRAAFIAAPRHKLISADYSQIELRVLSHVANIEPLKQAFAENRDIHTQTASQIFDLTFDKITSDIRRKAKAINFGIIYGISDFGLARQLNISKKEANDYIQRYFTEYLGIQSYMNETIESAKENGFVENLLGRKCFIPTINNKNHALRSFGERAAINAPMQSLTSDIVKMAMITLDKELTAKSLQTKILLQIHDELIFEAPIAEVDEVSKLIKSIMEKALKLDVATNVDVHIGNNWQEV